MIAKMVGAGIAALQGVIKIVVLFAVLLGIVAWGKGHPVEMQALFDKLFSAAAAIINWICNLIIDVLGGSKTGTG